MNDKSRRQNDEVFTVQLKSIGRKIDTISATLNKVFADSIKHGERQKNDAVKLLKLENELNRVNEKLDERKTIDNDIIQTQSIQAIELEACSEKIAKWQKILTALMLTVASAIIYHFIK